MGGADGSILFTQFLYELILCLPAPVDEQSGKDGVLRSILHMGHHAGIEGRDLESGMHFAGGRSRHKKRNGHATLFHLLCHQTHFVEGGENEAGKNDHVRLLLFRRIHDFSAGAHDPQINNGVIIALEHQSGDVFPDVVHIPVDRGNDDLPRAYRVPRALFRLDGGHEDAYGLFHHPGAFDDLREEHPALPEKDADLLHALHEGAFDDLHRVGILFQSFLHIAFHELVLPFGEKIRDAFFQGKFPPLLLPFRCGRSAFCGGLLAVFFPDLDQFFRGVRGKIEHDGRRRLPQFLREFFVRNKSGGIHDAHIEAVFHGMMEKDAVDGLPHRIVPPEGEGDVADAAADVGQRHSLMDLPDRFEEILRIVRVFRKPRADGEDVGVENDVLSGETEFFRKERVRPAADFHPPGDRIRLSLFVAGQHQKRRAVRADKGSLLQKGLLPLLQGKGVDHALPLHAFEARFDDLPAGGVDHEGDFGYIRFGNGETEKVRHLLFRIQKGVVHIHVDDLRPFGDLGPDDLERFVVLFLPDEVEELFASRHVGPLPDVGKGTRFRQLQHIQSGKTEVFFHRRRFPGRHPLDRLGDGLDMGGGRAAAAAYDVHDPLLGEGAEDLRHFLRSLGVIALRVGKPRIGVGAGENGRPFGKLPDMGFHFRGPKSAVETDGKEVSRVGKALEESLRALSGKHSPGSIRNRPGKHHGHGNAPGLCRLGDPHDRRLGVEGVEDGFDENKIRAAVQKPQRGKVVGFPQFVEGDIPCGGIVGIRREGSRPSRGAHAARHEPGSPVLCGELVGAGAGHLGAGLVDVVGETG